ncbi:MAG: LysM peptidoglycan-binding domain-containing protein [Gammaproteobacteria bacterium]|nr:LysM peptidoglycan-binding domain-containing protein [Gammaproteobacteria bacterium]
MSNTFMLKARSSTARILIGTACVSLFIGCQSTTRVKMIEIEMTDQVDLTEPELPPTPLVIVAEEQNLIESFDDLWERLQANFLLGMHYENRAVDDQLTNYIHNQDYFDRIAERAEPFLFWIVGEIERRELPMELALLPIVESTFNPNAYSPKHAVGLWQFMGPTAKSFGLQQDWWYDGRRDPRASTIAALDFLEQLYLEFNQNWLLALAAYNTGSGNVKRAIKQAGMTIDIAEFWSLPLANETKAHVPKILALAKLISNSQRYGIELSAIANEEQLVLVEIDSQIDLSQAANLADLDYGELRRLNPGYLQWATHPDNPQVIAVPIKNAESLQQGIANLGPDRFITWDRYEIQPGDTLGGIAIKLGTEIEVLTSVNQIQGSRIIAGDSLLVARTTDLSLLSNIKRNNQNRRNTIPVPNIYTIRNGDNLWKIARRFDLKSRAIANWNGISIDSTLQPGQELNLEFTDRKIPNQRISATDTASEYKVRSGDAMIVIASKFNIDLPKLLTWNNMTAKDLIFPGQLIRITPPELN